MLGASIGGRHRCGPLAWAQALVAGAVLGTLPDWMLVSTTRRVANMNLTTGLQPFALCTDGIEPVAAWVGDEWRPHPE